MQLSKSIKFKVFFFFAVFSWFSSFSQVNITGVASTTGICANDGQGKIIPDIVISETVSSAFLNSHSLLVLTLTSNYQFNKNTGEVFSSPTFDFASNPKLNFSSDRTLKINADLWYPPNNDNDGNMYLEQYGFPLHSYAHFQRTAIVYTASDLGLMSSRSITGLSFFANQVSSPNLIPIRILIKTTTSSNFTGTSTYLSELSGATLVFDGNLLPSDYRNNDWVDVVFDVPFNYIHGTNIEVLVETNKNAFGSFNSVKFRAQNTGVASSQIWYDFSVPPAGTGSLSFFKPNIAFHYNFPSTSLDIITLSGLAVETSIPSLQGQLLTTNQSQISGISGGTLFGNLISTQSVQLFGFEDKYCQNGGKDTLEYFPEGGVFTYTNPYFGGTVITTLSGAKVIYNPDRYNDAAQTNAFLTYSVAGFAGCTSISKNTVINKVPNENSFTLPAASSYGFGNNASGISLAGTNIGSDALGFTKFSGAGVVGNTISGYRFFPDILPLTLPELVPITYTFTNSITGCSRNTTRQFTIYNPAAIFLFSPTPPLETVFGVGKFCVNDYNTYSIALNGSISQLKTPEVYYSVTGTSSIFGTNYCPRSASFTTSPLVPNSTTAPGIHGWGYGITTTLSGSAALGNISSFKFSPNLISVAGYSIPSSGLSFTLDYNFDFLLNSLTGCSSARRLPIYWGDSLKTGTRQTMTVYPVPITPVLGFSDKSYCLGQVSSTDGLSISNAGASTKFEWFSVNSLGGESLIYTSSVSDDIITILGMNTFTTPGTYNYRVKAEENGCRSNAVSFTVTVKPIPTVPGVSALINSLPGFCDGTSYNITLKPDYTISGTNVIYKWFKGIAPTDANATPYQRQTIINENSVNTTTSYFVTVEIDGCSSNQLVSSVPGTIAQIPIIFNPLPNPATVVGSNVFCQFGNISLITVVGTATSALGFNWYTNNTATNPALDPVGTTTSFGMNYTNIFNSFVNTSTASSTNFFVKTKVNTTGCESSTATQVNVIVNEFIQLPIIFGNQLGDTLNGKPFCYEYGVSAQIPISISGNSLYSNPIYVWYGANTITSLLSSTIPGYLTSVTGNTPGLFEYYVKQQANSCESNLKRVLIRVLPPLTPPFISQPPFYCTGQFISPLTALTSVTGSSTISWFVNTVTSFGATSTGASFNPQALGLVNSSSASTQNIFSANLTDRFGCVSTLTSVNIEIRQTPVAPQIFDVVSCAGTFLFDNIKGSTSYLSVMQDISWIVGNQTLSGIQTTVGGTTLESDLNLSFLGNNFSNSTTIGISIRQNADGCLSEINTQGRIFVLNNPISPPTFRSYDNEKCVGEVMPILEIQSSDANPIFRWTVPGIGSLALNVRTINSGVYIPSTSTGWVSAVDPPTPFVFYSSQTINYGVFGNATFNGCSSGISSTTLSRYENPPVPSIIPPAIYCAGDIILPITAVGVATNAGINWFATSLLGSQISNQNPFNSNVESTAVGVASITRFYLTQTYNECISPSTFVGIRVNPLPIVDILIPKLAFCTSEQTVTVAGSPLSGNFNTSIIGFNNIGGGNATFTPTVPGDNQTVRYTYTDGNNCTNSVTKNLNVFAKPNISLDFPSTQTGYCAIANQGVSLFPIIQNTGTLDYQVRSLSDNIVISNAVQGNSFRPDIALRAGLSTDSVEIRLIYTVNSSSCKDTTYQKRNVFAQPTVRFDIPGRCEGDTLEFEAIVSVSGNDFNNLQYTWRFGVSDTTGTGELMRKIKRVFKVGSVNSSVRVETPFGCSITATQLFQVGPYPKPDFIWKYICKGSTTDFKDTTLLTSGDIIYRKWDFGILSTLADTASFRNMTGNVPKMSSYLYPDTGTYAVTLVVMSDKFCINDTTISVNVLPRKTITKSNPYFADFNSSKDGWFTDGKFTSWQVSDASNILLNNLPSTQKTWLINTQTALGISQKVYSLGQTSAVNSPCFDISELEKPMISMKIKADTREGIDGSVLQYSVDDGTSWINVGQLNSGVNWYNNDNILANSNLRNTAAIGFLPNGWSGQTFKQWTTSKNIIDLTDARLAANKNNVRFRVTFASASAQTDLSGLEGIAFDDVSIGERSKLALIEHFINENNDESRISTVGNAVPLGVEASNRKGVDDIINNNSLNVTAIKYHTSFPDADFFNSQNPADPSARVLFYGVQEAPTTILDGSAYNASVNTLILEDSLRKVADLQTLELPDFNININKNLSGDDLSIAVDYKANVPLNVSGDTSLILYVAVVERMVTDILGKNGQNRFESVLKIMLPDAAGTVLNQSWTLGAVGNNNFNWKVSNVSNSSQIGIVAFIQNTATKKVLQAAYNGPIVNSISGLGYGNRPTQISDNELVDKIKIYPNPSSDQINIWLPENLSKLNYTLTDNIGKIVLKGEIPTEFERLNIENIPSGMYLISIYSKDNKILTRKIAVMK